RIADGTGARLSAGHRAGADGAAAAPHVGVRDMSDFPWLTVLTLTPLAGAVIVAGVDLDRKGLARGLSFCFSLLSLFLAVAIWQRFDNTTSELQFVERYAWIPALNVDYFVAIDGLGLLMVLLSALVVPFA